jgi:ubiquinone/menaquinone biosynthesis C-methylase UbiE
MAQSAISKTKEAYKDPTWLYDIRGFFILTFAYRDTLWRQIAFFNKNIKAVHAEIAVGSGTLFSMILLWRRLTNAPKAEIHASDYVESMLDGARKKLSQYDKISIIQADLRKLPYPDQMFDSINVANSLHCVEDIDQALFEIFRVLKKGGTFASNTLTYPGKSWLDKISHWINNWGIKKAFFLPPTKLLILKRKWRQLVLYFWKKNSTETLTIL